MTDFTQISGGSPPGGVLPDPLTERLDGIGGGAPSGGLGWDVLVEVIGDDLGGAPAVIPFPGPPGPPGPSAYQVWLSIGNEGTEADFFASLQPGVAGATVLHRQDVPAAEWLIPHTLAPYPIVSVYDSSGAEVFADVEHLDASTVVVRHAAPTSGVVRLN